MPILRLLLTLLSVNVLQKKEVSSQVCDWLWLTLRVECVMN
jgi:hypothetical protein